MKKKIKSRKHQSGVWHHRVPDFKLVYCGEDGFPEKKIEFEDMK